MTKSKDAAITDLLEQAQTCSDIAADQHEIAESQLASAQKSVAIQHKNAEKLEILGEALVDEAADKMWEGQISEQAAPRASR
jgi:hypothetical protein